MSEEVEDYQDSQELIPTEQDTITFQGKPLIVVRLADGRNGVVLRWICENLHVAPGPQVLRIKRTEVIADDLVYVQVETEGGFQKMPTLVLNSVPYWLATIDTRNMDKDDPRRADILAYQRNAVAALFAWASTPRAIAAPTRAVVPAEPMSPAPNASALAWAEYHRQMAAFYEWKAATDTRIDSLEERQSEMESRLDEHRRVLAFIPDILERLGTEKLTVKHQQQVQALVGHLSEATGKTRKGIYADLYVAFEVPRYQEIHEEDWEKVQHWFQVQLERAKGKG